MDSIMLGAGQELSVFCLCGALQSFYYRNTHPRCKVRIFTIGFLASSPPWITEDINIWCPDRKTQETLIFLSFPHSFIVFGPCFVRYGAEDTIYKLIVKRGSHANWLGKNSHTVIIGEAMQRLAPPVKLFYAQTGDSL